MAFNWVNYDLDGFLCAAENVTNARCENVRDGQINYGDVCHARTHIIWRYFQLVVIETSDRWFYTSFKTDSCITQCFILFRNGHLFCATTLKMRQAQFITQHKYLMHSQCCQKLLFRVKKRAVQSKYFLYLKNECSSVVQKRTLKSL